jgi:hypothetical protein
MTTNFEVRFLLTLWDLGEAEIAKGTVNSRFSGRTKEANAACASLVAARAIATSPNGKLLTLTDSGKALLKSSLADEAFQFEAQIGAKTANALLKWWRSQPGSPMTASLVAPIASYEAFKTVALATFDRLNRDFNLDNLVPIYRIRREIGERVARSEFDRWLLEMQAGDVLQLQGGSLPDGDAAKLEDSITTELSGLRCYATRLAV